MEVVVKGLTVNVKGKHMYVKTLLDSVSFRVPAGELVALMGPSGAGKTTLLNRLVGRGIKGEVTGDIVYNGQSFTEPRSDTGYVTQDDIMYERLTPKENLTFAAKFLQGSATAEQQRIAVDDVLQKLRLVKCADTLVGTPGLVKGISGGERKRTNIGLSLLGRPSLLLLDEPTSGLDSKIAEEVMRDMSDIAKQDCTIIATIHQPSEAVFNFFTKVLVLESGKVAYFGDVDGLRAKIASLGIPFPAGRSLPEVLLDVLEAPLEGSPEKSQHAELLVKLRELSESAWPAKGQEESRHEHKPSRLSFCGQIGVLFRRNLLIVGRSTTLTVVRFAQTLLATILISWIFNQLDTDMGGVRLRLFAIFLLIFISFMFPLLGVINTFPAERAVFLREAQDQWYHPAAFYFAKVAIDTVMQFIFPLLSLIGYFIVGLNTGSFDRILYFYLLNALTSNLGAAVGFAISAKVSDVSTGLSIAPGMMMPQLLFCGVFIPIDSLPQPFRTFSFLAGFRYILQGAVVNEFLCDTSPSCLPSLKFETEKAKCGASPCDFCCSDKDLALSQVCPVLTCEEALLSLGFDDSMWPVASRVASSDTLHLNLLMLVAFLVLHRFQGLIMLMISYRTAAKG